MVAWFSALNAICVKASTAVFIVPILRTCARNTLSKICTSVIMEHARVYKTNMYVKNQAQYCAMRVFRVLSAGKDTEVEGQKPTLTMNANDSRCEQRVNNTWEVDILERCIKRNIRSGYKKKSLKKLLENLRAKTKY